MPDPGQIVIGTLMPNLLVEQLLGHGGADRGQRGRCASMWSHTGPAPPRDTAHYNRFHFHCEVVDDQRFDTSPVRVLK